MTPVASRLSVIHKLHPHPPHLQQVRWLPEKTQAGWHKLFCQEPLVLSSRLCPFPSSHGERGSSSPQPVPPAPLSCPVQLELPFGSTCIVCRSPGPFSTCEDSRVPKPLSTHSRSPSPFTTMLCFSFCSHLPRVHNALTYNGIFLCH